MKAIARLEGKPFTHRIEIGGHVLTVDEPEEKGGRDQGPTPQELLAASLASCVAITIEMYAQRKGWDLGAIEVECEYDAAVYWMSTRQALGVGLSSERYSLKPPPTRPSAKYHTLLTGPGCKVPGVVVGDRDGLGDGHGVAGV
jgi:putative redox protein